MKLFPPQDDVKIYEEGFGEKDLLSRRPAGERLSELLDRVEDPIVVAIDGPWGSGKSHFLKRWVGAHTIENGGNATTVYFDAFANDYLDDPLIALTGAVDERLPGQEDRSRWKQAKEAAFKLARPAIRIGIAATTAGASEAAGAAMGAAIHASGNEAKDAADAFWRREESRKAAMLQFKDSLGRLTSTDGSEGKPLIVVIDELDRCRPDYALSVLEVIKHFFAVPKVHFVLGINMHALEHMVRARYGIGINSSDYLRRFISLSIKLPIFLSDSDRTRTQAKYFETTANLMGIDREIVISAIPHLKHAAKAAGISLRDVERFLTRLALFPKSKNIDRMYEGWKILLITLSLFEILRPTLYDKAFSGNLTIDEIDSFYGIEHLNIDDTNGNYAQFDRDLYIIRGVWLFIISGGREPEGELEQFSKTFGAFGVRDVSSVLSRIETDFFGLFEFDD